MEEGTKPNIDQSVERIVLNSDKKVSDRTNIIIGANSFLFVPLVQSFALSGYLQAIPIILCGIGIGLNAFLRFFNIIQIERTKESLRDLAKSERESPFFANYFKGADTKDFSRLYDVFNKYAPILFIVAWILCLVFSLLQITFGVI